MTLEDILLGILRWKCTPMNASTACRRRDFTNPTRAKTLDELKQMAVDAVRCHFGELECTDVRAILQSVASGDIGFVGCVARMKR